MSRVAAIIVTYNSHDTLKSLMEDIAVQTCMPDEVIVVDNGSADGAEKIVKEKFAKANYMKMPENTGSAGGYYAGIEAAMKKSDFVWTLDDDVRVPADSMEKLLAGFKLLETSHKIAIARSGAAKYPASKIPMPMEMFTWRGSLIMTEVFAKEGMINKDFFMYGEEMDMSYRLSKKGYEFFWIPDSACIEARTDDKSKYTIFGKTHIVYSEGFRLYYAFRNQIYIYMRNGRYLNMIKVLLYGFKIIPSILFNSGSGRGIKIKAMMAGIVDGFIGKLGKIYGE